MICERGVSNIKCHESVDQIENLTNKFWTKDIFKMSEIIDIGLLSEECRQNYANIGIKNISQDVLDFVLNNIYWINICLYVNQDFREAVYDSIVIEQALGEVDESDYVDLRDDMRIASVINARSQLNYDVNIDKPLPQNDVQRFNKNVADSLNDIKSFKLDNIYTELQRSLTGGVYDQVVLIDNNLVYALNAFDKNDILYKYVTLVVKNVRDILGKQ